MTNMKHQTYHALEALEPTFLPGQKTPTGETKKKKITLDFFLVDPLKVNPHFKKLKGFEEIHSIKKANG